MMIWRRIQRIVAEKYTRYISLITNTYSLMQRTLLVCTLGSHNEDIVAGSLALAPKTSWPRHLIVGLNNF
jgi:hypothetical protein